MKGRLLAVKEYRRLVPHAGMSVAIVADARSFEDA